MTSSNELPRIQGHASGFAQHPGPGLNQRPAEPRTQQLPLLAPASSSAYPGGSTSYSNLSHQYSSTSSHYPSNYDLYSSPSEQGQYPPTSSFSQPSTGLGSVTQYHHHELPHPQTPQQTPQETPQPYPDRIRRGQQAVQSYVGHPGFPPVSEPCGERTRFTPEDDDKLKFLKENATLSWKQIAEFFPGRVSGTLQVRYCTKLKDKATVNWSRDMDNKLRKAKRDDESGRWSRVAQKLGNGISPQACEQRWKEVHEGREGSTSPFLEADDAAYV